MSFLLVACRTFGCLVAAGGFCLTVGALVGACAPVVGVVGAYVTLGTLGIPMSLAVVESEEV